MHSFSRLRRMPMFSSPTVMRAGAAAAALAALAGTGCSTVQLDDRGNMQATYVAGEFRMLVNANAPATAKATSEAFKQLGMFEIQHDLRTYDAELAARTQDDAKVKVRIQEVNSKQTEVGIRVDVVGDKDFSRQLYERIEQNLAKGNSWW